ncbi:MAG: hypothetical protein K1X67_05430 [Fimbriimonadaceae bacterium]|nr:hypothetical protein [Fimbriimonadaceae bacterium]
MKTIQLTRQLLVVLSVTFAAGLLFTNVYNSLIDAPNWGKSLPASIETTRAYFSTRNPGDFYRTFSPVNQIVCLLAVIFCWNLGGRVRMWTLAALAVSVLGDMFTFAYFFPRNAIMFEAPIRANIDAIRQAHAEWSAMNWVRSACVALNLAAAFGSLFALTGLRQVRLVRGLDAKDQQVAA